MNNNCLMMFDNMARNTKDFKSIFVKGLSMYWCEVMLGIAVLYRIQRLIVSSLSKTTGNSV